MADWRCLDTKWGGVLKTCLLKVQSLFQTIRVNTEDNRDLYDTAERSKKAFLIVWLKFLAMHPAMIVGSICSHCSEVRGTAPHKVHLAAGPGRTQRKSSDHKDNHILWCCWPKGGKQGKDNHTGCRGTWNIQSHCRCRKQRKELRQLWNSSSHMPPPYRGHDVPYDLIYHLAWHRLGRKNLHQQHRGLTGLHVSTWTQQQGKTNGKSSERNWRLAHPHILKVWEAS